MKFIDALIPNKKNQLIAVLSLILVILAIPIATLLLQENQDIRQQAASCKEECPGKDGVLRSCTPPDSDGSSSDSICTFKGRVEACGSKSYCCPSVGGKWTLDMTACATPTPTKTASPSSTVAPSTTVTPTTGISPTLSVSPTGTDGFLKQDINQDRKVDQADLTILITNYRIFPFNNARADLNGDGIVNALDYAYLLDAFGQTN